MATGTVKTWDLEAGRGGAGYIAPDGGGADVFVEKQALEEAEDAGVLAEGHRVSFEMFEGPRGREAAKVVLLG